MIFIRNKNETKSLSLMIERYQYLTDRNTKYKSFSKRAMKERTLTCCGYMLMRVSSCLQLQFGYAPNQEKWAQNTAPNNKGKCTTLYVRLCALITLHNFAYLPNINSIDD